MDIEDLLDKGTIREDGDFNRGKVVTRRHKRRVPNGETASQIEADSSFARGQKIYVRTWGCTHNTSDSEYMAGQLAEAGYDVKLDDSKRLECDLWLLNSCTVKAPAEDHFKNAINAAQKVNIPVVVAGCVPQGAPSDKFVKGLSTIGVQQIDRVVEVVEETLKGNTVKLLGPKKRAGKRIGGADLGLPKVRRNALIEIISINTGCLNSCTYCKTKHARGDLASYPVDEIVARFEQAFEQGIVEVWLTSEDTGAYGRDIGTNIVELLNAVVKTIPEGCMMRIGMTNPPYILEHLDGIAKILNHPRVYSFLHVPVQSGSDAVLNSMRREYNRDDFCKVVDTLRANVPDCNIATDIIAGFPTETEEDFDETVSLCEKYKFPSLFMNQFFPRPGTPAAKWEQIPRQVIKERTKKLSNVFKSYLPFEGREGERHSVLITEMAHDKVSLVGHTKSYHQILVKGNPDELMGKRVDVVVEQTTKHSMLGRVVSEPKSVAIAANLQILKEKEKNSAKSWTEKKLELLSEKLDLKIVGAIACASFIYFAISRTRSSL